MGKCLVSTFRGSVNDPDLKYFDALQFKIDWAKNQRSDKFIPLITNASGTYGIRFGGEGVKVKILSNGTIKKDGTSIGTEFTIGSNPDYTLSVYPVNASSVTEFLLIGLDNISTLWSGYIGGIYCKNSEDLALLGNNVFIYSLEYPEEACAYFGYPDGETSTDIGYLTKSPDCDDITTLRYCSAWQDYNQNQSNYAHISMSDLAKLTSLTALNSATRYVGDISEIKDLTALTNIQFRYPEAYGDIRNLGKNVNATAIILAGSKISGTLEDLIAELVAAGKTSGSINGFRANGLITFEGHSMSTALCSVSWTDADHIAVTPSA